MHAGLKLEPMLSCKYTVQVQGGFQDGSRAAARAKDVPAQRRYCCPSPSRELMVRVAGQKVLLAQALAVPADKNDPIK